MLPLSTPKSFRPKSAALKKASATSKPAPRGKTAPTAIAPDAAPKRDEPGAERAALAARKTSPRATNPLPEAAEVHAPKLQRTAK